MSIRESQFAGKAMMAIHKLWLPICLAVVIICTFTRLFLGVEFSDEALGISEARLVAQGGVPFYDIWIQACGHTLLYFWLIPLFEWITGGTEGLFLFMRIAYFVFKLFSLAAVYLLLQYRIQKQPLLFFVLLLVPYAPFNMNVLSYNSVVFLLLFPAGALLYVSLDKKTGLRQTFCCMVSGVLVAFSILSQASVVLVAVWFGVLLLYYSRRIKQSFWPVMSYILGGLATAAGVTLFLIMRAGSLAGLTHGIGLIMESGYFSLMKLGLVERLAGYVSLLKYLFYYLAICAFIWLAWAAVQVCTGNKWNSPGFGEQAKKALLAVLLVGLLLYIVGICCLYAYSNSVNFILAPALAIPLSIIAPVFRLFVAKHGQTVNRILLFLWIPMWSGIIKVQYQNTRGADRII